MPDNPVHTSTTSLTQELHWYFTYAEPAASLGPLTLLPLHEMPALRGPLGNEDRTERPIHERALSLVRTIKIALAALPAQNAGVLRAVYTPRRWPLAVRREFAALAPLAVRLTCTAHPWPLRTGRRGLEGAAAQLLARMIADKTAQRAALRREATRLLKSALSSYARTRHQGGSSIAR